MMPFYSTRCVLYEGHTDYRADPVAIANPFRLARIEDIDAGLDLSLARYEVLGSP